MLGIDPGENSLSLPPPRLGTSEAAMGEQRGRLLRVVSSISPIVTVLTSGMDRRRTAGSELFAEPRGYRCLDVSQREVGKSRFPKRWEIEQSKFHTCEKRD